MTKCPNNCPAKYASEQWLVIKYDEKTKLPTHYECPVCGYRQDLSVMEKVFELIYSAEWYFNLPENWDMDEYFIEEGDVDRVYNDILTVIFGGPVKAITCEDCGKVIGRINAEAAMFYEDILVDMEREKFLKSGFACKKCKDKHRKLA